MDSLLNDRYELREVLGSGGMGEVRRAHDHRLDRTVAIKFLRHGPLADDVARARMRSEALLAASIHHPGVAQVFDYGESEDPRDSGSFIVMQYIEGHSLAELLRVGGPMAPSQVMSIVVQASSALQAAHAAGIVHRDIKPGNIMLTPTGRAVLVDFGLARSDASEPLTDTGTVLGTAQYSSPEQSAGRPATAQSDLYSLGIVAHHCLTGQSPFRRDTPIATALAHLNDERPPLGDHVPQPVQELIAALTAKNPSERPADAAAVAARASAIGADASIHLPESLGTVVAIPSTAASSGSADETETADDSVLAGRPSRSRSRFGVLAVAALLIVALVGAWRWMPGEDARVPDLVGMDVAQASAAVRDAGMTPRTQTVDVVDGRLDEVVDQAPEAGAVGAADGVVELSVASGKVAVAADDVIGLPYATAVTALEKLGFVVARTDVVGTTEAGQVVALDRSGRLEAGSTITLTVTVAPVAAPSASEPSTSSSSTPSSGGSPPGSTKTKKTPQPKKTPKAKKN